MFEQIVGEDGEVAIVVWNLLCNPGVLRGFEEIQGNVKQQSLSSLNKALSTWNEFMSVFYRSPKQALVQGSRIASSAT